MICLCNIPPGQSPVTQNNRLSRAPRRHSTTRESRRHRLTARHAHPHVSHDSYVNCNKFDDSFWSRLVLCAAEIISFPVFEPRKGNPNHRPSCLKICPPLAATSPFSTRCVLTAEYDIGAPSIGRLGGPSCCASGCVERAAFARQQPILQIDVESS